MYMEWQEAKCSVRIGVNGFRPSTRPKLHRLQGSTTDRPSLHGVKDPMGRPCIRPRASVVSGVASPPRGPDHVNAFIYLFIHVAESAAATSPGGLLKLRSQMVPSK
jgi:hypothetical protein